MREYAKVYTAFWSDTTTRAMSEDARSLALYILTCPHGNLIGLFRLPDAYAADDLQWPIERVSKGFRELFEKGFCARDETSSWLVILKYLRWNQFENPNVAKNAAKVFDLAPNSIAKYLCARAILKYGTYLSESFRNSLETVPETVSEPYRKPEPSQSLARAKPEPEPEPEPNRSLSGSPPAPPDRADVVVKADVRAVFDHWREVLKHPQAKLDEKRIKAIASALRLGYSVDQLRTAIDGCSRTPHNMGQNDRNTVYDDLGLILRDADHIDRFIRNASRSVATVAVDAAEAGHRAVVDAALEYRRRMQGTTVDGDATEVIQ